MHQVNKTRTTARGYTVRHSSRRLPEILSGRTSRVSQQPLVRSQARPEAVPALIQALSDSVIDVQEAAADALGKIEELDAAPALLQVTVGAKESVRRAARVHFRLR